MLAQSHSVYRRPFSRENFAVQCWEGSGRPRLTAGSCTLDVGQAFSSIKILTDAPEARVSHCDEDGVRKFLILPPKGEE
jgi:hypothetical protein